MHHIADARVELEDALSDSALPGSPMSRRKVVWPAIAATLLLGLLVAYFLRSRSAVSPIMTGSSPAIAERQITSNPIEDPVVFAAISPDGKYVAYNDSTAIRIRLVDTGETRTLSVPANFCFR